MLTFIKKFLISIKNTLLVLTCVYLIYLLLCYPAVSLDYARTGLLLWFEKMIPTLLPFMIISGIMMRMNLTEPFIQLLHPVLHLLFGTSKNGSYIIFMGFLCGFPMGSRIIAEFLEENKISNEEASYLLYFCNNIGPIFFLSYVIPMTHVKAPFIALSIMYGVPFFYGILLNLSNKCTRSINLCSMPSSSHRYLSFASALDLSVLSGLIGIAKLGGYMILFNLLAIITTPFPQCPLKVQMLYRCILEITGGISICGSSYTIPILILLPFGGLSCIAQTYSMIQSTGLSIKKYMYHKLWQTCITFFVYVVLSFFLEI